ncbi:hypothetical protein JCGZ_08601 [Jatropha curcas]|uniref:Uncharacterized protein n=1 Tax=Jatropha curcas TaxID=180498 RepID=A0A067KJQ1_JATCU|nr:hypothetical protein JCGZ_08601 [Jatropha curcas]
MPAKGKRRLKNEGTRLVTLLSRSELKNRSSFHLLCHLETNGERDWSFAVNGKEAAVDRACWICQKYEERTESCRSKSQLTLFLATLK